MFPGLAPRCGGHCVRLREAPALHVHLVPWKDQPSREATSTQGPKGYDKGKQEPMGTAGREGEDGAGGLGHLRADRICPQETALRGRQAPVPWPGSPELSVEVWVSRPLSWE